LSRRQLRGVAAVSAAIESGQTISLLLMVEDGASAAAEELARRAEVLGIEVRQESKRELRRMCAGDGAVEILGLEGPSASQTLDELMASDGIVFLLVGLRYPGNVGYILRCLEVAGGAGVVLDTDWGAPQRDEALRVGMRADRFFPVIDAESHDALRAARAAGRRVVALETAGRSAPWEVSLKGPLVLLVGSESTGIPDSVLGEVDEIVTIPVGGFIPSYNVQAAVGIVLGEWMRQNA
jgi:tRNA G18 (ribose-2'-O)-methylase SpoU